MITINENSNVIDFSDIEVTNKIVSEKGVTLRVNLSNHEAVMLDMLRIPIGDFTGSPNITIILGDLNQLFYTFEVDKLPYKMSVPIRYEEQFDHLNRTKILVDFQIDVGAKSGPWMKYPFYYTKRLDVTKYLLKG